MRTRPLSITVVLALTVAACAGAGGTAATSEGGAGTPVESSDGVHAAETDLGSILVDPDGFTLYVFMSDTAGVSVCYEACADLWPPVPGDLAISSDLDASMFSSVPRDDGGDQLAVGDMPLYRYTPDTVPGDTSGQGLNGVWFVVDTSGQIIEAAAGATDALDYGY